MKILYGDNALTQEDKNLIRSIIHNNTITTMQTICEYMETFGLDGKCEAKEQLDLVVDADENDELTPELGEAIWVLWKDPGIQATWDRRGDFQIVESMKYYFKHVKRISEADYMNKDTYTKEEEANYQDDALYARVRTSGIVTEAYDIDGHKFEMYDVGGQRNERRKWIHCFESVTAIIFVAALSEYNQNLFEDGATNRMVEALELFEEICNNKFFGDSSMILFLNKKDLFEEKIKIYDIKASPAFSDYEGGMDYKNGCDYFTKRFMMLNKNPDKTIYSHVTCATDTKNVQVVMDSCKDIILRQNMEASGLM
jgi:GTPase SAR1 family protein